MLRLLRDMCVRCSRFIHVMYIQVTELYKDWRIDEDIRESILFESHTQDPRRTNRTWGICELSYCDKSTLRCNNRSYIYTGCHRMNGGIIMIDSTVEFAFSSEVMIRSIERKFILRQPVYICARVNACTWYIYVHAYTYTCVYICIHIYI